MKKLILITISIAAVIVLIGITGNAQTPEPTPCAENCVTISRDAAIKAVETSKERDALKERLKAEQQATEDMRKELNEMRVKFAAASGELSGLKQAAVRSDAIIDLLLKSVRPKKIGLINF